MTSPTPPDLLTQIEGDLIAGTPVADVLRKLVLLGGQAGSAELRDWASRELRGYANTTADDLPDYRKVMAAIQVDAIVGNHQISGQSISPAQLPEGPREVVTNEVPFFQGIGEIQAIATSGKSFWRISLPSEQLLGQMIDRASGQRFQRTTSVYWSVSVTAIEGIVDQVKTRLVELLAELRAATTPLSPVPTAEQAANAVNVVVHGRGNRVQIAHVSESGQSTVGTSLPESGPFWTFGRRVAAFAVGAATILATVIAVVQWQTTP